MIEAGAKLSGKVWLDLNRDRLHQGGERPWPAGARNCCCPTTIRPRGPPACAAWSSAPVRSTAWSGGRDRRRRRLPHAGRDAARGLRAALPVPSGYQYATPVDGDNGAAQSGARPDTDAGMLVDLSIAANADITGQSLPVIPSGVVYGSSNRQPLAGAMVRLSGPAGFDPARHLVGGAGNAEQRSSDEGMYQFLLTSDAPSGRYQLLTRPSAGYVSPSTALPPAASPGPAHRRGPAGGAAANRPAAAWRGHHLLHPVHGIVRQPARGQQPPAAGPGRDPGPAAAHPRASSKRWTSWTTRSN